MVFEFIGTEAFIRDQYSAVTQDTSEVNILLTETPKIINHSTIGYGNEEAVRRFHISAKGFNEKGEVVSIPGNSNIAYYTKTVWFKDYDYFYCQSLNRYNPHLKKFIPVVKSAGFKVNLPPYVFSKKLGIWGKVLKATSFGFSWGTVYKGMKQVFEFSCQKDYVDAFHIFSPYPLQVIDQSTVQPICTL